MGEDLRYMPQIFAENIVNLSKSPDLISYAWLNAGKELDIGVYKFGKFHVKTKVG